MPRLNSVLGLPEGVAACLFDLDGVLTRSRRPRSSKRAHVVVSSVEKSLGRIQPPSAVAAEHRALRKDVHAVARQIAELATSLRTGDTETFNAHSQLPALAGVTAETDAIRQKGYDILGTS